MLATTARRLRTLLAAFILPFAGPALAQIISHDPDLTGAHLATPSGAQNISPRLSHSASYIDGTARLPIPFALSVHANPFESSVEFTVASPDLQWSVGSLASLDIDLELPCRGISWPVGRTQNASQRLGEVHHDSNGPQGVNWFARMDAASDAAITLYRGVNGTAGTIEHVHGSPDLFRYTDPRGARAVFFGVNTSAPYRLWHVQDSSSRTSFVGSMQSPAEAIERGYGHDGQIDLAFDAAGRRYDYSYSAQQIGGEHRLLDVTVTQADAFVARVSYSYYVQTIPGAGLAGDLKTVATTKPLSNPSKTVTYRKHYRYWTDAWTAANPGHPHSIRMIIEPEGVRRATLDGFDPDTTLDTPSLARYASSEFEYDATRRIAAFKTIALATSNTPGADPLAIRNTVEYESGVGPDALDRVIVHAAGHFTTLYFDAQGMPLSAIKSESHPSVASSFKVHETARDEHGFVIYRGTPRAASGYQHLTGRITRRESGGLALHITRIQENPYLGFAASQRVHDGGAHEAMLAAYSYRGQSDTAQLACMNVGGGVGYELVRPLISNITRFENANGTSPLTTTLTYRMNSDIAPLGSPLAVRVVTRNDPVITRDRHGDGAPRVTTSLLDDDGTPLCQKYPSGRVDAIEIDDRGLIVSSIRDLDSARFTSISVPPEFQSDLGVTPIHRITRFEYDLVGRLRAQIDPGISSNADRRQEIYWDVLADGKTIRFDIPHVANGTYYGPAEIAVVSHNQRVAASFLIGFPGAEYTLEASRTEVSPQEWITDGADGYDSIVGPPGSRRAMMQVAHHDPAGEYQIRSDTYSNIPEAMPGTEGAHFHSARSRFLRGIEVESIDENDTIDGLTIDSFDRERNRRNGRHR